MIKTKRVRWYMEKQTKKYYKKYKGLLTETEKDTIFYYLYPYWSAINHELRIKN